MLRITFKPNDQGILRVYYGIEEKRATSNILSVAIIAYYNAGAEAEYLRDYSESQIYYETA